MCSQALKNLKQIIISYQTAPQNENTVQSVNALKLVHGQMTIIFVVRDP